MSTFPTQSWPLPAASFAWSCRAAGGLQSFHLSEVSLVREWMAQQLWTLQTGMLISFFNGCVCTLGSPVPAKLRGDGSQHPRAKISLEKAGTTVCPLPAHYGGNPESYLPAPSPSPGPAHSRASPRASFPPSHCGGQVTEFGEGCDMPQVVSSELRFVTPNTTLCCFDTGLH